MYANRQIFLNNQTTTRASLRSAARINQYYCTPSVYRFVRAILNQLTPSRIADTFSKAVVSLAPPATLAPHCARCTPALAGGARGAGGAGVHHVLDGEVLEEDRAVAVHQFTAQFVGKVFSPVSNTLMDVRDDFATLGSLILVPSSLRPAKFNFITAKEARIVVGDTVLFSNIETQGCSITS
jgi:hypothetical protein